ncbi:MAG: DUF1841 family protein, partial [Betaproteobacteria bacterium]|nr:DUF1841 family protein [Betaproteobacteria bacterium]
LRLRMDQPGGFARLDQAAHQGIECLGRVLWEAQRRKSMPDTEAYLACLRRA